MSEPEYVCCAVFYDGTTKTVGVHSTMDCAVNQIFATWCEDQVEAILLTVYNGQKKVLARIERSEDEFPN